jgi:hypothetical protein
LKALGSCAVALLDGFGAATPNKVSQAAAEQRIKARLTRGLKLPDLGLGFFLMILDDFVS